MEQAIQLTGSGELRRSWGWYLVFGIVLIVLGTIAIGSAFLMTIASVFFFGWLMIIGGVMEAVHAFWHKRWAGFFLDLLTGILYIVACWMMVTNPTESAVLQTLIIAMFLVFEGVFRIVAALAVRYPHWGCKAALRSSIEGQVFTGYCPKEIFC